LIEAVVRPVFRVHLDPVSLFNCQPGYYRNADSLCEWFSKLDPWIVLCHAQDIT
jgi:hypothetical protein